MTWNIEQLRDKAQSDLDQIADNKGLEEYRIKYLGKKGIISQMYASLAEIPKEEKPKFGKDTNDLKNFITQILNDKKSVLQSDQEKSNQRYIDVTLPGVMHKDGHKHILNQTIEEICSIFEKLGFSVQEGPEIETEFNNFSALNIPDNHPSRDGFDTFYLQQKDPSNKNADLLLRSHTSPGQIRIMQEHKPPLAVVIPGKVFRPDAVDASHSFMFHQIEGLLVDKDVKFSDLKGLLTTFLQKLFGDQIKMRFRPHFFPFTEPSAEVDIACYICDGKGCSVCGKSGWLEIMGCGMVHPHVFKSVGHKKGEYTGLAFGLGVERLTMLKYGINDIRIFFENDQRFLSQF